MISSEALISELQRVNNVSQKALLALQDFDTNNSPKMIDKVCQANTIVEIISAKLISR